MENKAGNYFSLLKHPEPNVMVLFLMLEDCTGNNDYGFLYIIITLYYIMPFLCF